MTYVVMGTKIIAGLTIAMLVYLWVPQKKKKAVSRIDAAISKFSREGIEDLPLPGEIHFPAATGVRAEQSVKNSSWKHARINGFYGQYVAPYEKILNTTGYLEPINALLDLLDEYGDCPSVIKLQQDMEYQASKNLYDLLAKTSLLDHTLNVAKQMVFAMNKNGVKNPELFMGKILVAAIGHDIGKIPELIDSQQYSKGDHPYISYLVLKKVILPDTFLQKEEILTAVKEHHYQVQEGLAFDLKTADHNAREIETDRLSEQGAQTSELIKLIRERKIVEKQMVATNNKKPKGSVPAIIDLSWLNLTEFLSAVEPKINKTDGAGHFTAFSTNNGIVYLMLDIVSKTMISLAKKHQRNEILINCESKTKKRSIEYTVKTMLDEQGFIPSFIGKGYAGARFALIDESGSKKLVGIYMPIVVKAFKTSLFDLEKRKPKGSFLTQIAEVRPLTGKKK